MSNSGTNTNLAEMKIKATAYDTQNGEPREMDHIRWVGLDQNGRPQRICAPNGIQYREFELHIEEDTND